MKQSNVNVPQLSDSLQNVITQKEVLEHMPRKYRQCIGEGDNFVREATAPKPPSGRNTASKVYAMPHCCLLTGKK